MSVIWVVERNEQTRERLIKLFTDDREEVKGFSFPEEAEKAVQHGIPDVLIVECDVGNEDDSLRLIRSVLQRHATLPVVVLTDNRDPDFRRDLFELGVTEVMYKPYDPILLRLKVKNLQRIRQGSRPATLTKEKDGGEERPEGIFVPVLATGIPYVRYGKSPTEIQDIVRAEKLRAALEEAHLRGEVQRFLAGLWLGCPRCRHPLWGIRWVVRDIPLASHTAQGLRNAFWDWIQSLPGYLSHELPEKREAFEKVEWLCPSCHVSFSPIEASVDLLTGYSSLASGDAVAAELRGILERAGLAVAVLPAGKTLDQLLREAREAGQEALVIRFVMDPHGMDFLKRALAVVSHILKKYTPEETTFTLDPCGKLAVLLPEGGSGSAQRLLHQLTYYVRRFGIDKAFRIGLFSSEGA